MTAILASAVRQTARAATRTISTEVAILTDTGRSANQPEARRGEAELSTGGPIPGNDVPRVTAEVTCRVWRFPCGKRVRSKLPVGTVARRARQRIPGITVSTGRAASPSGGHRGRATVAAGWRAEKS